MRIFRWRFSLPNRQLVTFCSLMLCLSLTGCRTTGFGKFPGASWFTGAKKTSGGPDVANLAAELPPPSAQIPPNALARDATKTPDGASPAAGTWPNGVSPAQYPSTGYPPLAGSNPTGSTPASPAMAAESGGNFPITRPEPNPMAALHANAYASVGGTTPGTSAVPPAGSVPSEYAQQGFYSSSSGPETAANRGVPDNGHVPMTTWDQPMASNQTLQGRSSPESAVDLASSTAGGNSDSIYGSPPPANVTHSASTPPWQPLPGQMLPGQATAPNDVGSSANSSGVTQANIYGSSVAPPVSSAGHSSPTPGSARAELVGHQQTLPTSDPVRTAAQPGGWRPGSTGGVRR